MQRLDAALRSDVLWRTLWADPASRLPYQSGRKAIEY